MDAKKTPVDELKKPIKRKINFKFRKIFTEKETEYYDNWFSFYPKGSYFKFRFESYGYFDPRPQITTNITSILVIIVLLFSLFTLSVSYFHLLLIPFLFLGWGDLYIKLPFDTGMNNECESPAYGFYMYHIDPVPKKINFPTCFIWQWDSYKSFDMLWSYIHIRHSILLKNGTWADSIKGDKKDFWRDEWKEMQYVIDYDFTDKYDNSIIPAKIYVEEREWRQRWLKWTSLFSKVRRSIDVKFSKEVGSRKGSWKGGVVGCGYEMKKGETPLDCIKRMELKRNFK